MADAAPPGPTAPAGSLDALPADVLVVILRLLPLVPRIRTIATVSKRWRELAYRSVDALTDYPLEKLLSRTPPYHKALRLLTSLRSLNLRVTRSCPREYTFPATLRHLAIRSEYPIVVLEPRPALASLALRCYVGRSATREDASDLIAQFASSLRRLDLFCSHRTLCFTVPMAMLHLPHLTDLTLGPDIDPHIRVFYGRHASQLETLTIRYPYSSGIYGARYIGVADVPLPRLRTLTLDVPSNESPPRLQQLLSQCPALTALYTNFPPRCGASVLRTVTLCSLQSVGAQAISECPRLEGISAINLREALRTLADYCHLITHCKMSATMEELCALPCMTRLRSVVLAYPPAPAELPPLPSLTSLRELTIISLDSDVLSTLDHFLHYCPGISKVTLSCRALCAADFTTLVRQLDRCGVAELTVVDLNSPTQLAAPADLHWLRVHKLAQTPRWLR